jgi:hypothetical protein
MPHELELLVAERENARFAFIQARLARDSASRYLDAVIDDFTAIRAAWDALAVRQEEMDRACDHLATASSAVIAYLMEDGKRRGRVRTSNPTASDES